MKTTLKQIVIFFLNSLLLANIYGQSVENDTTVQGQLSIYRQLFWENLPESSG